MKNWNKIFHFGALLFAGLTIVTLFQKDVLSIQNNLIDNTSFDCSVSMVTGESLEIPIFLEKDQDDNDLDIIFFEISNDNSKKYTLKKPSSFFDNFRVNPKSIPILQSDLPPPFFI